MYLLVCKCSKTPGFGWTLETLPAGQVTSTRVSTCRHPRMYVRNSSPQNSNSLQRMAPLENWPQGYLQAHQLHITNRRAVIRLPASPPWCTPWLMLILMYIRAGRQGLDRGSLYRVFKPLSLLFLPMSLLENGFILCTYMPRSNPWPGYLIREKSTPNSRVSLSRPAIVGQLP